MSSETRWVPLADAEYNDGDNSHFKVTEDGHTVKVYSWDADGPFTIGLHFEDKIRLCRATPSREPVPVDIIHKMVQWYVAGANQTEAEEADAVLAWLKRLEGSDVPD